MREILFRGQTRKLGEKVTLGDGKKLPGRWVYGGIFPGIGDFSIIYGGEEEGHLNKFVVYSDTVGQYTGLTDKHGVKIFDGDFIKYSEDVYRISWYQEHNAFMAYSTSENEVCYIGSMGQLNVEVIGNIHDNPELLEEAEAALETREDE